MLLFAVVARIPTAATSVVVTLWVVLGLHRGYGAAGLVVTAMTAGTGIGSPWRGRLLDSFGLRRAILPSIVVEGCCWALVPLIGYAALLPVVFVAGLFAIPVFNVVRQSVAVMAPQGQHDSAFMLDSIGTEFTFMIAPAAGVILATAWSSAGAVFVLGAVTVLAGVGLLVLDPPLRRAALGSEPAVPALDGPASSSRFRQIFTREMTFVIAGTAAAVLVLGGTEVSVVAHLRQHGQSQLSSLVFVVWSMASAIGGFGLGARGRPIPLFGVLLGLGLLTIPVGFAPDGWWLVLAIIPAGLFCAPTLSATASAVGRLVPEHVRGEAMGWYSTATTTGLSIGAPLAGFAIDHAGPWAGFVTIGTIGVVVAVIGLVLVPWRIDRPGPAGPGAPSGVSPTRRLRSAA